MLRTTCGVFGARGGLGFISLSFWQVATGLAGAKRLRCFNKLFAPKTIIKEIVNVDAVQIKPKIKDTINSFIIFPFD